MATSRRLRSIPLSVLDRSSVRRGREPAEAVRETVRFARRVEELGYHRFWVSEHHGVPGLAGPAPTVLAAAVAAATSRIRVGTGGVMLPNHRPLVVAEQFGVLQALHPGRIDMGVGRSLAFTGAIRRALGTGMDATADFSERLAELLGYFTGDPSRPSGVRAYPGEGLRPAPFLLATGEGALVAAGLGLPLVVAPVGGEGRMVDLIARYRERFRPSVWSQAPYVVVSGNVAVAESAERARSLLVPEAWANAHARVHGVFPPLEPAEEIEGRVMSRQERERFDAAMRGHVHGTGEEVAQALEGLVERTGADELLVTTSTFDREEMLDSYRRLARVAALA
ncbi:LLM class flavin-dependent oxidoreductase [Marinactinospora thermotolerans]|uniref:LLM class flavin-dependent oxidoreductase n=1 Tax=Marinactinospora thermotolerans TaxID=531310 RepID=UPI00099A85F5|nr:LLM class flavin-dependent oxidoreductase [Marinactinospora thermotolerans]